MLGFRLKVVMLISLTIASIAVADDDESPSFAELQPEQGSVGPLLDPGPIVQRYVPVQQQPKKTLSAEQIMKLSLQDGKAEVQPKDDRFQRWTASASNRADFLTVKPYNPPDRKVATITANSVVVEQEIPTNIPKRNRLKERILREVNTGLRQVTNVE